MKKILKWIGIGFAALLVAVVIGAWAMFGTFVKAANSIEKLEDGLYSMEFTDDYGFDGFLAESGADSDSGVAGYLTSFLSHGFYKNESKVETGSFGCSTIYTQDADGMNSEGLVVADLMAGDTEETHQQTGKTPLTTTTAIRLLLDKASSVDEAIRLLRQYDMNSSIDSAHHLSIADATGKSVVVEYVDCEMLVTETKVVTNHYLSDCEKQGVGSEQSHKRYDTLAAHTGPADAKKCWKAWHRKTFPRRQTAMKRPCGASSTTRRNAAQISILRRTLHTAMD